MISKEQLIGAFDRNVKIVEMQAEGLDHADSLAQTDYEINCFNWTVGHLVATRDALMKTLGREPRFGSKLDRYLRESEPIKEDGPGVVAFDELLGMLRDSQVDLSDALEAADDVFLQSEIEVGGRTTTPTARVFFYFFHDSYHAGQTELLRQVAGMADSII